MAVNDTQRIDAIISTFRNCIYKIAKDALQIVKQGGTLSDELTDLIGKHYKTILKVDELKEVINRYLKVNY